MDDSGLVSCNFMARKLLEVPGAKVFALDVDPTAISEVSGRFAGSFQDLFGFVENGWETSKTCFCEKSITKASRQARQSCFRERSEYRGCGGGSLTRCAKKSP